MSGNKEGRGIEVKCIESVWTVRQLSIDGGKISVTLYQTGRVGRAK